MPDLVGVSLPLKQSGDTPFQGMPPINVGIYAKLVRLNLLIRRWKPIFGSLLLVNIGLPLYSLFAIIFLAGVAILVLARSLAILALIRRVWGKAEELKVK